jgi:hypothetical protein
MSRMVPIDMDLPPYPAREQSPESLAF